MSPTGEHAPELLAALGMASLRAIPPDEVEDDGGVTVTPSVKKEGKQKAVKSESGEYSEDGGLIVTSVKKGKKKAVKSETGEYSEDGGVVVTSVKKGKKKVASIVKAQMEESPCKCNTSLNLVKLRSIPVCFRETTPPSSFHFSS